MQIIIKIIRTIIKYVFPRTNEFISFLSTRNYESDRLGFPSIEILGLLYAKGNRVANRS